MKIKLALLAFLTFPFFAAAQIYIDGRPIDEVADINFVDVCAYQVPMSTKIKATVNYGQPVRTSLGFPSDDRITDEEGTSIKFNSFIQLLNLFDENGFEYFGFSNGGDGYSCYLFRKFE